MLRIMKCFFRLAVPALFLFLLPLEARAQFTPKADKPLTIIATDGTFDGKDTPVRANITRAAAGSGTGTASAPNPFTDPIRPLGMRRAMQAGAFLERPLYGKVGYLLIFSLNDSIGGQQGVLEVNGQVLRGVYRLIRPLTNGEETIPKGESIYEVGGTIYILGVS